MTYNATVYRSLASGGESTFVAEVDDAGRMLRSNAIQCTGYEGTPAYDTYVRGGAFAGDTLRIVRDGMAGYRARLSRMALPPTYPPSEFHHTYG